MTRANQILTALLVLQLGIAVTLGLTRKAPSVARAEPLCPGFSLDKVTRIEITGATGTSGAPEKAQKTALEKKGAGWIVPEAEGYVADTQKVTEFLEKIGKAQARGPIVTKARDHARLEVADDHFQRHVVITLDGKPFGFYVGSAAGTQRSHVRKDGSNDVLPVAGIDAWSIGETASQWIDRSYVKLDEAQVWSIAVTNPKGSYKLERHSKDENWTLADLRAGETLDDGTVSDVVRKCETVSVEEPLGKTVKPEYGLGAPGATVTVEVGGAGEDGKRPENVTTQTLAIGSKDDATHRYRVKSSASDWIVEVADWGLTPLVDKGRDDLLKKSAPPATPAPSPAPATP